MNNDANRDSQSLGYGQGVRETWAEARQSTCLTGLKACATSFLSLRRVARLYSFFLLPSSLEVLLYCLHSLRAALRSRQEHMKIPCLRLRFHSTASSFSDTAKALCHRDLPCR